MIITTVVKNSSDCGVFLKKKLMMNNIDNEHWKNIEGYDGMYQVSDLGRVRSLKFGKTRIRRPRIDRCGYLQVGLCKDGNVKSFLVHRLVANAFIPNDDKSKNEINHINEDKTENKVSNLEWCDRKYNNTYNDIQNRRKSSVRRKIEKLYNPNLTYKQNLEIFKSNGIECCRDTVVKLRKDLNLIN